MSIILKQIDRTSNSVTFSVSGVTGDRLTYIWLPMASGDNKWFSLLDAYNSGYIQSYSATDSTSGKITVNLKPDDAKTYKVWQFLIHNYSNGSVTETSNILTTVLEFNFDNYNTKNIGDNVDITVNDMQQINLFGLYIKAWITNTESYYYTLEDVGSGDKIFADYLILPTQNIYDTANILSYDELPNRDTIMSLTKNIIDNVYSGAEFKAEYFNDIRDAINSFNLITV